MAPHRSRARRTESPSTDTESIGALDALSERQIRGIGNVEKRLMTSSQAGGEATRKRNSMNEAAIEWRRTDPMTE